jgi:hypothetical protein
MQFFTLAWWCGVQEGTPADPSADYCAHLAALRGRVAPGQLPTLDALLALRLHDSRLRHLRLEPLAGTARLVLDSYDGSERVTLAYSGVQWLVSETDPDVGLGGPHGYGDLGYDEVDVLPHGEFVHRMLFSSGIELAVMFNGFELLHGDGT